MRWIKRPAIFLLFIAPALILAGEARVASTGEATPIDPASPRGAMLAIGKLLPAGGLQVAMQAYAAKTDKEKTSAKALARAFLASAALEAVASKKFGPGVIDDIDHAMRMQSDADLAKAHESIDGDHASIEFAGDSDSLPMIKVDGAWKIDVSKFIDSGQSAVDFDKSNNDVADALEQLTAQAKSGEFANAYLLERAIKQRMFRVLGDEDVKE